MKTKWIALILMVACLGAVARAAEPGDELFEKAKTLIFDKQWAEALKSLEQLIARHAGSRHYATALFYRGKCQEQLGARRTALESYEEFLAAAPGSNLAEEALVSVVDLSAALYPSGGKEHLKRIEGLLGNKNKVVSYYAALKLSYMPDRGSAARALPVLLRILEQEQDEELRDRAKIAVMRIDPGRLKGAADPKRRAAGTLLRIYVAEKGDPKGKISIAIPLALADVALRSLGAKEKQALKREGYDAERLLAQLLDEGKKIDIQAEDVTVRIWIE
jgi:tetratricopeptide (TPR) repeat protein